MSARREQFLAALAALDEGDRAQLVVELVDAALGALSLREAAGPESKVCVDGVPGDWSVYLRPSGAGPTISRAVGAGTKMASSEEYTIENTTRRAAAQAEADEPRRAFLDAVRKIRG